MRMPDEFRAWTFSYQSGRSTRNVEPRPSSLSTWIVPPCIKTRRRVIARPSPVPRRRAPLLARLFVLLEDDGPLGGGDPGAGVAHGHRGVRALLPDHDHDLPLVRELDGVADQVREDLTHAPRVRVRDRPRLPLHPERDRLAANEPLRLAHDLVRDDGEVDLGARQFELAALDRAELEDVVDQLEEVRPRAADLLYLFARRRGEGAVDLGDEDVGEAEDRVERAPELVAHCSEERRPLTIRGRRPREVSPVGSLGRREPPDERVEAPGEEPHLVERSHRDRLAGGLRPFADHPAHALGEEDDLFVRVARDGIRDRGRHADEERRERDEGGHECGPPLGRRGLAHERHHPLKLVGGEERVRGEARPSERGDGLPMAELRHPPERHLVRRAEACVQEEVALVVEEQELGPGASRRKLQRFETLPAPRRRADRRKAGQTHGHRRRQRLCFRRGVLVACARERIEPDDPDPDRHRQPHHEHDERRENEERERVARAVLGESDRRRGRGVHRRRAQRRGRRRRARRPR